MADSWLDSEYVVDDMDMVLAAVPECYMDGPPAPLRILEELEMNGRDDEEFLDLEDKVAGPELAEITNMLRQVEPIKNDTVKEITVVLSKKRLNPDVNEFVPKCLREDQDDARDQDIASEEKKDDQTKKPTKDVKKPRGRNFLISQMLRNLEQNKLPTVRLFKPEDFMVPVAPSTAASAASSAPAEPAAPATPTHPAATATPTLPAATATPTLPAATATPTLVAAAATLSSLPCSSQHSDVLSPPESVMEASFEKVERWFSTPSAGSPVKLRSPLQVNTPVISDEEASRAKSPQIKKKSKEFVSSKKADERYEKYSKVKAELEKRKPKAIGENTLWTHVEMELEEKEKKRNQDADEAERKVPKPA